MSQTTGVRDMPWFKTLNGKRSEDFLIAAADCPKCLSKNTIFHMFHGERVNDAQGMMKYIVIHGETHICRSCLEEFVKTDGPWIGLTVGDWAQGMKHGLIFDRVHHYTNWLREMIEK